MDLSPLKIDGIILNQPLFGGRKRTKSEMKFLADQVASLPAMDLMWELALPEGADRDHPFCNPMADGPHKSKLRSLQRCLVFGFGRDPLVDRQQEFVQMLILHGANVEACFDDSGFHRIDIVDPQRAAILDEIAKGFIDS
jgi:acetyl esterase/lipase